MDPVRILPKPTSNPFSTRAVRPGAIEYHFASPLDKRRLALKLAAQDWWGQIVGPHGSGKSTLLRSLLPELSEFGRNVTLVTLHQHQHEHPLLVNWKSWNRSSQLIVDGFEQLRPWSRWALRRRCQLQGAGLLATGHQPLGLPLLHRTQPSPTLARELVRRLLADRPGVISEDEIDRSFVKHDGNLREVFFELYDLYERHNQR